MINLVTIVGTLLPRGAASLFPDLLWRMPAVDRTAYLTFDDGPNPTLTRKLMDILARHDARATFFLIGSKAERQPDLVRALAEGGHSLGNHTYTHPDPWRTPRADLLRELDRTTVELEAITSKPIHWMRPPYGHFTRPMRAWCGQQRQQLTMWDLAPADYLERISAADVERHVHAYIRKGSVIVLHDNPRAADATIPALERLLGVLTSEGWRFEALPSDPSLAAPGESENV